MKRRKVKITFLTCNTKNVLTIHKNESKIISREIKNLYMCFYIWDNIVTYIAKEMKNLICLAAYLNLFIYLNLLFRIKLI